MYTQKDYENQLREILEKDSWSENLKNYLRGHTLENSATNVIWAMCEILKEDSKYLDAAMMVVEAYKENQSSDTTEYDEQIKNGEEVGFIYTVKATLAHLLVRIIFQFDTEYYPRILEITEELIHDPSIYIAREAVVALEAFAVGIYATKKADGSPFILTNEQKQKILDISFEVLTKYREYPQALEYVVHLFNYLRRLSEEEARVALKIFIFKDIKTNTFQPHNVLEDVAPLLIYYAEFRTKLEDGFNSSYFKDLLKQIIKIGPSDFRTDLLWHCWKAIDQDESTLIVLREYVSLFFDAPFTKETSGQMELAVQKMISIDTNFGIELYKKFFNQLISFAKNQRGTKEEQIIWLIDAPEILSTIAEKSPEQYSESLDLLFQAWSTEKILFGDYASVFNSYHSAPEEKRDALKKVAQEVYKKIQTRYSNLKDMVW